MTPPTPSLHSGLANTNTNTNTIHLPAHAHMYCTMELANTNINTIHLPAHAQYVQIHHRHLFQGLGGGLLPSCPLVLLHLAGREGFVGSPGQWS